MLAKGSQFLSIIAHSLYIFHKMGNKPPSVLEKGHNFLSFITHSVLSQPSTYNIDRGALHLNREHSDILEVLPNLHASISLAKALK